MRALFYTPQKPFRLTINNYAFVWWFEHLGQRLNLPVASKSLSGPLSLIMTCVVFLQECLEKGW